MVQIYLIGELNKETCETFIAQLNFLAKQQIQDIRIDIDTLGGSWSCAYKIHETIESLKKQNINVQGVVVGECSSFGLLVLQACSSRFAKDYERKFGMHFNRFSIEVTVNTLKDDLIKLYDENIQKLRVSQELFCLLIEKRTMQSQSVILGWIKDEKVMSVDEALANNLIDGISG